MVGLTLLDLEKRGPNALYNVVKEWRHYPTNAFEDGRGHSAIHILSLPIVMFATIFLRTVLRFWNFLSFASAAWSSTRNSWVKAALRRSSTPINLTYLDLATLKELGILSRLSGHARPNKRLVKAFKDKNERVYIVWWDEKWWGSCLKCSQALAWRHITY